MIDLRTFFLSHFDSDRISDDKIRAFAADHLQRLSETGAYPLLFTALSSDYTSYFGAITDEAVKTAIREGQTKAVDNALEAIKKAISQHEGSIRSKYGKESATYQEFLPQGLTEYNNANLSNIEEKLARFISAATTHAADLPAGFVAIFTGLQTAFVNARNAQLGSKGLISTGKAVSAATRDAVETQLMKNVLTIALDHVGDPQGGLAFFDQSILGD